MRASGREGLRVSSARILNIVPRPEDDDPDAKNDSRSEHALERHRIARQVTDHKGQSTAMALLHLPHHADCPICLRLQALAGKGRRAHMAAAVKAVRRDPAVDRSAPLGSARNPITARTAARLAEARFGRGSPLSTEATSDFGVCTVQDAVEQVCNAETGVCGFQPRKVTLCDGVGAMPVILAKEARK